MEEEVDEDVVSTLSSLPSESDYGPWAPGPTFPAKPKRKLHFNPDFLKVREEILSSNAGAVDRFELESEPDDHYEAEDLSPALARGGEELDARASDSDESADQRFKRRGGGGPPPPPSAAGEAQQREQQAFLRYPEQYEEPGVSGPGRVGGGGVVGRFTSDRDRRDSLREREEGESLRGSSSSSEGSSSSSSRSSDSDSADGDKNVRGSDEAGRANREDPVREALVGSPRHQQKKRLKFLFAPEEEAATKNDGGPNPKSKPKKSAAPRVGADEVVPPVVRLASDDCHACPTCAMLHDLLRYEQFKVKDHSDVKGSFREDNAGFVFSDAIERCKRIEKAADAMMATAKTQKRGEDPTGDVWLRRILADTETGLAKRRALVQKLAAAMRKAKAERESRKKKVGGW